MRESAPKEEMTKADEEVEDMAPRRVTAAARPVTSPETVPREDQVVVETEALV